MICSVRGVGVVVGDDRSFNVEQSVRCFLGLFGLFSRGAELVSKLMVILSNVIMDSSNIRDVIRTRGTRTDNMQPPEPTKCNPQNRQYATPISPPIASIFATNCVTLRYRFRHSSLPIPSLFATNSVTFHPLAYGTANESGPLELPEPTIRGPFVNWA